MRGSGGCGDWAPCGCDGVGASQNPFIFRMHRAEPVHSRQGLQRRALHPAAQRQVQQSDALQGVKIRNAAIADVSSPKPQVMNIALIVIVVFTPTTLIRNRNRDTDDIRSHPTLLRHQSHAHPAHLHGGQRRRVALLRTRTFTPVALLLSPLLLLLAPSLQPDLVRDKVEKQIPNRTMTEVEVLK